MEFFLAGFVVGQAGLYHSIAMFMVAYFIITMTVLSVCAISTNGALHAGGAYCILDETKVAVLCDFFLIVSFCFSLCCHFRRHSFILIPRHDQSSPGP